MNPQRILRRMGTLCIVISMAFANPASGAGFIFAGEANGIDIITHPSGYTGTGGNLVVTVGIDPTSANASSMVVSVQNVINTFNEFAVTTGNLASGVSGQFDFESVLLHEMGHSLGLAHCNAATESGLSGTDRNYTKATDGVDNTFNLNAGTDAIKGSRDDTRGDDVNLNYFRIANNNPAGPLPATVDLTTYSRDTADLPGIHTFAANGDRAVNADLGFANTEAVMQQGTFSNEFQRTLTSEDIAALRIAMAGLDETQGTADDYTLTLSYAGMTTSADIVIDFDDTETGFAVSQSSGTFLSGTHLAITSNNIYFNTGFAWHFNPTPNGGDPDNVFVDFNAGSNGGGSESSPFDNLADAVAFANDDADINIEPGTSSETFTGGSALGSGNQPMTLLNNDSGSGSVRIGVP